MWTLTFAGGEVYGDRVRGIDEGPKHSIGEKSSVREGYESSR